MSQLKLPFKSLPCCNPQCMQPAAYGDWFCSLECYERTRIMGLQRRAIDRTVMIVALMATAALGLTAFTA